VNYKGKNFLIIEQFGILKKGMLCYCFDEDKHFIRLWFDEAVIGDTHEIKIAKTQAHILKER
jgi:hypothetical protein